MTQTLKYSRIKEPSASENLSTNHRFLNVYTKFKVNKLCIHAQIPTLVEPTDTPSFQNKPFKRYPCFVRVLERAMLRA